MAQKLETVTLSEMVRMAQCSKSALYAAIQKFGLPTGRGTRYTCYELMMCWRLYHEPSTPEFAMWAIIAQCADIRRKAGMPIPEAWQAAGDTEEDGE